MIMSCYFWKITFSKHGIINWENWFVFSVTKDKYEAIVESEIKSAQVLDHTKHPCQDDFIPDTKVRRINCQYVGRDKNIDLLFKDISDLKLQ